VATVWLKRPQAAQSTVATPQRRLFFLQEAPRNGSFLSTLNCHLPDWSVRRTSERMVNRTTRFQDCYIPIFRGTGFLVYEFRHANEHRRVNQN
jgi:hypothetical protein